MLKVRKYIEIVGANRIGSSISLDEIPKEYKHLKVLGRGATSIVLDESEDSVLMFTRDQIKKEWLQHTINAKYLGEYESYNRTYPKMRELVIYILRLPKLFPLSKENKRKVKQIVKKFKEVSSTVRYSKVLNTPNSSFKRNLIITIQDLADRNELEFDSKDDLLEFVSWIANYDDSQYEFDLAVRQFLQTKDGEIVMSDPVVAKEIINIIQGKKEEIRNAKRNNYGQFYRRF